MARVRGIKVWDKVLSTLLKKNNSSLASISPAPFYFDTTGFYSKDSGVTYMYTIDGYPSTMETSFRTDLRNECRGDVRVSVISLLDRHEIDWNSNQMKKHSTAKYPKNSHYNANNQGKCCKGMNRT